MDDFEQASKLKLRFTTSKGPLATEDLWELKLEDLDVLAKVIDKQLREEEGGSFIPGKVIANKKPTYNGLRLELLKHVIRAKVIEQETQSEAAEIRARIAQTKALIADKAVEALGAKSMDELQADVARMEAILRSR